MNTARYFIVLGLYSACFAGLFDNEVPCLKELALRVIRGKIYLYTDYSKIKKLTADCTRELLAILMQSYELPSFTIKPNKKPVITFANEIQTYAQGIGTPLLIPNKSLAFMWCNDFEATYGKMPTHMIIFPNSQSKSEYDQLRSESLTKIIGETDFGSPITAYAINPQSTQMALGRDDGTISTFTLDDTNIKPAFGHWEHQTGPIIYMGYDVSGKYLFSYSPHLLCYWNTQTKNLLICIQKPIINALEDIKRYGQISYTHQPCTITHCDDIPLNFVEMNDMPLANQQCLIAYMALTKKMKFQDITAQEQKQFNTVVDETNFPQSFKNALSDTLKPHTSSVCTLFYTLFRKILRR